LAILKNKSEIELYGIKEENIETELLEAIDNNESLFLKRDQEGGFKKIRFSKGS